VVALPAIVFASKASIAVERSYTVAQSKTTSGGPILREWKGLYAGIRTPTEKVMRTPTEWAALWRQAHANRTPPAAPSVDFAKEMVIAVFMGQRSTGGYSIAIENVAFGEKEIRVTVREQTPPPDAIVTQALTQPFHMVVVRKSALPVKFIRAKSAA
jgi:hypothetical protein